MDLTYQQLLAEQYEELELAELEEEEEEFTNQEVGVKDPHPDELEDKDAYNKPGHNFGDSIIQKAPAAYTDTTVNSVTYLAKDILRSVVNVDSRFRENPLTTLATDYLFKLHKPLRNVRSIRLSSIEFPNTSYTFTKTNCNIAFQVLYPITAAKYVTITIPEGSYDDPTTLVGAVNTALSTQIVSDLILSLNVTTGKITISSPSNVLFNVSFQTQYNTPGAVLAFGNPNKTDTPSSIRSYDHGIGYNLGFRGIIDPTTKIQNHIYSDDYSYTAEAIVISIPSNYVFLSLGNDFPVLTHQYNTYDHINAFAKIFLTVPSFSVVFDSGANTVTETFIFKKPTDLRTLQIKVYDVYGNILDTNGVDFSFTLEVDEVINNSLYHTLTAGT